jgi:pyruvate ferredoxin oxidoreductase alpha subunit/phenylglyoxylate dehydrogenase alpha subunit
MNYRYLHLEAQKEALKVIEETDKEFEALFGRSYGGLIDAYRMDDAESTIVTMGSMTGAAKEAVDLARKNGIKIGLIKIRALRPFPKDRIIKALANVKSFGVIDRNVSFGWNTGVVYQEIKAALYESGRIVPSVPFIGGLGGEDLTVDMMYGAIQLIAEISENHETVWLTRE